jgi:hypothetical protein
MTTAAAQITSMKVEDKTKPTIRIGSIDVNPYR